jgi:hypothetical protein
MAKVVEELIPSSIRGADSDSMAFMMMHGEGSMLCLDLLRIDHGR